MCCHLQKPLLNVPQDANIVYALVVSVLLKCIISHIFGLKFFCYLSAHFTNIDFIRKDETDLHSIHNTTNFHVISTNIHIYFGRIALYNECWKKSFRFWILLAWSMFIVHSNNPWESSELPFSTVTVILGLRPKYSFGHNVLWAGIRHSDHNRRVIYIKIMIAPLDRV